LVLDDDLNDISVYDLYKNNTVKNKFNTTTKDDTFESYSEYIEKYKLKNTKKNLNSKNYKFINYDNEGSLKSNLNYNKNYETPLGIKWRTDLFDLFYVYNKNSFNKTINKSISVDFPLEIEEQNKIFFEKKNNIKEYAEIDHFEQFRSSFVSPDYTKYIENSYNVKNFQILENNDYILNMGDKENIYYSDEFENSKNKLDYRNYKELNNISDSYKSNKIEISNRYDDIVGLNFDFLDSTFFNTVSQTKNNVLGKSDYNFSLLDFFENNQRWSHRQSLENTSYKTPILYSNYNILDIRTFIKKNLNYSNLNFISIKLSKYSEVEDSFNYF
jgi:sulfur relay (sulfurtransferase) DsrF/TusC family protein